MMSIWIFFSHLAILFSKWHSISTRIWIQMKHLPIRNLVLSPSSPLPWPAQALLVYSVYCIIDNCVYYMFKNILLVIFEAFKLKQKSNFIFSCNCLRYVLWIKWQICYPLLTMYFVGQRWADKNFFLLINLVAWGKICNLAMQLPLSFPW